jgi:hypothetical protein
LWSVLSVHVCGFPWLYVSLFTITHGKPDGQRAPHQAKPGPGREPVMDMAFYVYVDLTTAPISPLKNLASISLNRPNGRYHCRRDGNHLACLRTTSAIVLRLAGRGMSYGGITGMRKKGFEVGRTHTALGSNTPAPASTLFAGLCIAAAQLATALTLATQARPSQAQRGFSGCPKY